MLQAVLAIIGSVLAIIIGLWKYFGRKAAVKRQKAQEAQDETNKGVDDQDPSRITSGFDRANRM